MKSANAWGDCALQHIQVLSKGIGARGSTSDAERRAAEYVRDELERVGASEVRLESFHGAVSAWLPWAVAFSIASWGMLTGLLLGRAGGITAVLLYLMSAWIVYGELESTAQSDQGLSASTSPARRWLARGRSQNVLGIVRPIKSIKHRVVLMANLDTARASFLWTSQRRRGLRRHGAVVLFFCLLLSAGVFFLAALTSRFVFYVSALILLLPQVAGLLAAIISDRNPFSPGANSNASGVGTLLALARRLTQNPLTHTEVWLLATGCRETGGDGVRAVLKQHRTALADATFLALEGVGIGSRVVYLSGERLLRRNAYSRQTLRLAARAAKRCAEEGLCVSAEHHAGGRSDMGIISRTGLRGLTVNSWPKDERGISHRGRIDDTFETMEKEALSQVHTFAWTLLLEVDSQS